MIINEYSMLYRQFENLEFFTKNFLYLKVKALSLDFWIELLDCVRVMGKNSHIDNRHFGGGGLLNVVEQMLLCMYFSRAHTIVAIGFTQKGKNEQTGQNTTKSSTVNLVDLAGR